MTAKSDMFHPPSQTTKGVRARQLLFALGLAALVMSAVGYVALQGPLRRSIALERELAESVGRIMTLDEVLTMSARMAASSHDPSYEERYNAHVDELDRLIVQTVGLSADPEVAAAVVSTDEANRRLVEMETRSFELDRLGKHEDALKLLESEEYRDHKATYAGGMARAFERTKTATSSRRASEERWALFLQLAALLSLATVIGAWTFEQRERRARAASYAAELSATVELRTSQLAERTRSMRLVLDTVREGLVGVDLDGWMSSERSANVERWLGPIASELKLADYVRRHDPRFADGFSVGLAQLKDDFLPLELSIDQMPRRLTIGSRTLAVGYEPILTDGRVDAVLVIMSDVTDQIERERAESEQREMVSILQLAARDRRGLLGFIQEANKIVDRLVGSQREPLATVRRLVHTLKGNAAQVGPLELSRVCHEIEETLGLEGALATSDRERIDGVWRATKERIARIISDRSSTHLEVEKAQYDNVVHLVGSHVQHEHILDEMLTWTLDPVQARLERMADYARALADRVGKSNLEVECDGNGLRIDPAEWASFWPVCVHLVRNAIDHGIETAEERCARGKPAHGRLVLSSSRAGRELVVRFSDDGAGIDWDLVTRRAAERGLPVESESQRMDALFSDGVSSREQATEHSGRGVGMAAVREEVERRGGRVIVTSGKGCGTTIEVRFPNAGLLEGNVDVTTAWKKVSHG